MVLGFSTQINKKPNHFVAKIWKSFLQRVEMNGKEFKDYFEILTSEQKTLIDQVKPKLHTIREDAHDRWKAGNYIHFVINNRTAERFQFAPVVKCISTQSIKIKHTAAKIHVIVDNKILNQSEAETLAINDGFETLEDFFKYFNKSFSGKLIHWTDKKY